MCLALEHDRANSSVSRPLSVLSADFGWPLNNILNIQVTFVKKRLLALDLKKRESS